MNFLRAPSTFRSYLGLLIGVLAFVLSFPVAFGDSALFISQFSPIFAVLYLLPLLSHIQKYPRWVFVKAWGFYVIALIGVLYWVTISMQKYGNLSLAMSLAGLLGTCIFRGLFAAGAIWCWQRFSTPKSRWMLGAALLTLQDFLLHYIPFGGFPWVSSGYALTPDIYWIQIADLVGVHGLGLTIYITAFVLFDLLQTPKQNVLKRVRPLLCLLVLIHGYGIYRYHFTPQEEPLAPLRIGWIQGNIHQSMKWNPREKRNIIKKYHLATRELSKQNPDLIVWPEAAIPHSFFQGLASIPDAKIKDNHVPLLFGAPSYRYQDKKKKFYNSVFLTRPDGSISFRYDKIHLVPFGEFVPSLGIDLAKKLPVLAGSFSSGESIKTALLKGHYFGVSICYEILYPDMFVELARQGATFFINITNDAWFDLSSGPFQHLRFSQIRAIETRKPILRVANTGISALYLPSGQITQTTSMFKDYMHVTTIYPQQKKTWFTFFPYSVHIIIMLMCSVAIVHRRKQAHAS